MFYEKDCFKDICEKCTNRGSLKGVLFKKYECNLNKKPYKDRCFYFKCEGKGNKNLCLNCPNYFENKNKEENKDDTIKN